MYIFVFKRKQAYEWRISDWSSDVCSSDLPASPIWPMLADLTAKELASLWESEQPNPAPPPPATTPPASSLDPIGSNTGLSGTTGASAGTIPRLVHAVAEKPALEAADGLSRRKRRARHSLAIIWRTASRPSSK